MVKVILCLILLCSQVVAVMAAQVEVVDGRYEGEKYVSISGLIIDGDLEKVKHAAKAAIREGNNSLALLLNSDGGDVVEAMKIGRFARDLLATTYVYGNKIYTPGTEAGDNLEEAGKKHSQVRFHLHPVALNKSIEKDVVHCYSACVIIFYGGVSRYVSDNADFRKRFNERNIPVIGIHRPYYNKDMYSSLSPNEAKKKYANLETMVREFMREMGAPTSIIDRMFRKSSNEVDLIPANQFEEFYHKQEPFIDEWLIARCGGSAIAALSEDEQRDYAYLRECQEKDFLSGQISVEELLNYVPPNMTSERAMYLRKKIESYIAESLFCSESSIKEHQVKWSITN